MFWLKHLFYFKTEFLVKSQDFHKKPIKAEFRHGFQLPNEIKAAHARVDRVLPAASRDTQRLLSVGPSLC